MKVEVRDLSRRFGKVIALDRVSFVFDSGHVYGFIGPNGAGKTTTMRILATLDEADEGDAFIDGTSITQYPEQARRLVGFVPDTLPAQRDMSVHDYLDFFARAHRLRSPQRQQVLAGIEEFTGLVPFRDRELTALSKGMKQRVSVARALIHDPAVLILDEPAAGLDPRARVELRELLRELAGLGKAILVSSHILGELGEICDGTVIIEQGRVIRAGSMAEVLGNSATGHTVLIRALGATQELHRWLLERPECRSVQDLAAGLELQMRGDERTCAALLRAMIEAGFEIVELRLKETDLESVFLQVTRGDIQ
jgi:ABC-2 type transport system ATP-binding protein